MNNAQDKKAYLKEVLTIAVGEAVVSVLTVAVFVILDLIFKDKDFFSYKVITGALLGSTVTLLNFFILSYSVNRAIDKYLLERGSAQMTEEEAEAFAEKHKMGVQSAATKSYILRTLMMIASLVLAGVSGWFNIVATVVPLLAYRPIIFVSQLIKAKRGE